MLAASKYPKKYIENCKDNVDAQVLSYKKLVTAAKGSKSVDAFEDEFFKHMVLVIDHYFVHRLRGAEGKDGNAANEVRILSASIMENKGVLMADKQINLDPDKSVLGLKVGDPISMNAT